MLSGADVSSYQGNIDWTTFKNNVNFVIIKMTEGTSYIDPWGGNNRYQARSLHLPRGFYHFARPDLNSPQDEAKFFIDIMNGQPLQEGESVYLDYETQYTGDNVAWVLTWMQLVEKALGVKPIFYSYQSMLTSYDWTPIVSNGNGLWVAAPTNDPSNNNFETGAWEFAMMQQWGNQDIPGVSGVIDSDVFFGDENAFLAYGYKAPQPQVSQNNTTSQPVVNPSTPTPVVPILPLTPITPSPVVNPPTPVDKQNFPTFIKFLQWLIGKLGG